MIGLLESDQYLILSYVALSDGPSAKTRTLPVLRHIFAETT